MTIMCVPLEFQSRCSSSKLHPRALLFAHSIHCRSKHFSVHLSDLESSPLPLVAAVTIIKDRWTPPFPSVRLFCASQWWCRENFAKSLRATTACIASTAEAAATRPPLAATTIRGPRPPTTTLGATTRRATTASLGECLT